MVGVVAAGDDVVPPVAGLEVGVIVGEARREDTGVFPYRVLDGEDGVEIGAEITSFQQHLILPSKTAESPNKTHSPVPTPTAD